MKKKWYRSKITKAILIVLAHVMVVGMTASAMWILSYPTLREELLSGAKSEKYEETRSFAEKMKDYSNQAARGISMKSIYETDGKYNPEKIIDIENYFTSEEATGKNESGFAYRLDDLLNWYNYLTYSADGLEEDSESEQIVVCKKADGTYRYYLMSEFYEKVASGELKFLLSENDDGITEGTILTDLQNGESTPEGVFRGIQDKNGKIKYTDFWLYDGIYLPELYTPVNEKSILSIVNENPRWNGRLDEAYRMLNSSIYNLGDGYANYNGINSGIEEGDTNFFYIYADMKGKRIYTNKAEYREFSKLETSVKKMKDCGKYVVVKPKLADFETNLKDVDAVAWREAVQVSGLGVNDYLFIAAVDTDYPVQDDFYVEARMYDRYGKGAEGIAVFGILALILFLGSVLWLCVIAGRNEKDNELHLSWFDGWKTEIGAAVVIALWLIPVMFGLSVTGHIGTYLTARTYEIFHMDAMSDYVADTIPYIVIGCMIAAYTCFMFLIGLLSLVRRIKANTVWKNSVTKWFLQFTKMVLKNLNSLWRTIVLFGTFLLAHWFIFVCFGTYWTPGVVFLLLVDIVAFVYLICQAIGRGKIKKGIKMISQGEVEYKIPMEHLSGEQKEIAEDLNSIGTGLDAALEKSMKSERLKTDLITNVSHDIKTPLTSIINYVELLKQEHFEDPKVQRYIEVLEEKSQRLKTLTEDVVEASKVSSGNITLEYINLNLTELLQQVSGEFKEKFEARDLREVLTLPEEPVIIRADGRRTWRILENIYNNAAKYAMENTRIYAQLSVTETKAVFHLKNISKHELNISADELTERFIRGDISRSTEGSGLGLSIAKSLTTMQGGEFELYLDGDLFKVTITFPRVSL